MKKDECQLEYAANITAILRTKTSLQWNTAIEGIVNFLLNKFPFIVILQNLSAVRSFAVFEVIFLFRLFLFPGFFLLF